MGLVGLRPFAPSVLLFKGQKGCPRTVVITQVNIPGIGADKLVEAVFLCRDKARLDSAQVIQSGANMLGSFTEGVAIGKTIRDYNGNFPNIFRLIVKKCESDIFGRADYFDATTLVFETETLYVSVEDF